MAELLTGAPQDQPITGLFTPEEKAQLEARARELGFRSLSKFVRAKLLPEIAGGSV